MFGHFHSVTREHSGRFRVAKTMLVRLFLSSDEDKTQPPHQQTNTPLYGQQPSKTAAQPILFSSNYAKRCRFLPPADGF